MLVQPYLFFEGRAEEAANFYRDNLGATAQILRYKDAPEAPPPGKLPPGSENNVMHMSMKIGDSEVMGSDGMCSGKAAFQGFALSLTARDEAEAQRMFNALANGGQVQMPLAKTFFSPSFGMLADRFGVHWMVYVLPPQ
jgi:PhnB protein